MYRGHGGTDVIATRLLNYFGGEQSDCYESKITVPTVFVSVACSNGALTDNHRNDVKGLCQNLVVYPSPEHGVVGAVGAIMPSPTVPNHYWAKRFMYHTYVEPKATIGEVFNAAMFDVLLYGVEENENSLAYRDMNKLYNIYSDPELPLVAIGGK